MHCYADGTGQSCNVIGSKMQRNVRNCSVKIEVKKVKSLVVKFNL